MRVAGTAGPAPPGMAPRPPSVPHLLRRLMETCPNACLRVVIPVTDDNDDCQGLWGIINTRMESQHMVGAALPPRPAQLSASPFTPPRVTVSGSDRVPRLTISNYHSHQLKFHIMDKYN